MPELGGYGWMVYVLVGAFLSPILMRMVRSFIGTVQAEQESPPTRMTLRASPDVRTRMLDLRQRVERVWGQPCSDARLLQMSLSTFDLLVQADRLRFEGPGPIIELILEEDEEDEPEDDEPDPLRPRLSRWDVLGEDEEGA